MAIAIRNGGTSDHEGSGNAWMPRDPRQHFNGFDMCPTPLLTLLHVSPLPLWLGLRDFTLTIFASNQHLDPSEKRTANSYSLPTPFFPFHKASNFVKHMKTNKTLTYLDLSHNLIGSQVRMVTSVFV